MKNIINSKEGITLVALVITITILIILGSIAIYTGTSSIQSTKLTAFTAEMKIMQTKVNELYQEYQNGDETVLTKGQDITDDMQAMTALQGAGESTSTETISKYRHYTLQDIKDLGLDGIKENEFLINIQDRSVISYKGFEYEGTTYYTLEQLPKGLYNVEYNQESSNVDFDTSYEILDENEAVIHITNITSNSYINKWQIRYKKTNEEKWNTTEIFSGNEYTITIQELDNYDIQVFNGEENQSTVKKIYMGKLPDPEETQESVFSTGI